VERHEYGVALDILARVDRYAEPDDADRARRRMEEIRGRLQETAEDPGGGGPVDSGPDAGIGNAAATGPGGGPGTGPGTGPDAGTPGIGTPGMELDPKAESAAERRLGELAVAVDREKWQEADRLLARLDELSGTRFFAAHRAEIDKTRKRIRLEILGYAALFKGEAKVIRGREVEVVYRFDRPEEAEDWVYVPLIAHPVTGNFWRDEREKALHGRGVGAVVNPAVFEPGKLTMQGRLKPDEAHDFGFLFIEPEEMTRFYMFSVQNRFFTIGYEREAAHETMIWIVGGTSWSDTKAGDIGFVRVAGTKEPVVKRGTWVTLATTKQGDRVSLTMNGKSITGSALGDDRFQYPALQPGLFLVETEVLFDDIVIRGTLDEKWAEAEMRRLRESLEK
jgi:hypothetical protein